MSKSKIEVKLSKLDGYIILPNSSLYHKKHNKFGRHH